MRRAFDLWSYSDVQTHAAAIAERPVGIDHLATPDAQAAVIQLEAEHRSLYRGQTPIAADRKGYWNKQTISDASRSYDAHQIKLVEA